MLFSNSLTAETLSSMHYKTSKNSHISLNILVLNTANFHNTNQL
ncbi:hypothetical protein PPBDW_p0073 (plasmid) [Photobacterium kishitanii]|nr:hypothetical protein PPBDW_p0073 [Photobacterium kishitanii]